MTDTAATSAASSTPSALRLPAVDKVLLSTDMLALRERHGLDACTQAVRETLAQMRADGQERLRSGEPDAGAPGITEVVKAAGLRLAKRFAPRLRTVFNLTGTVLHTNLGRALLPQEAVDAVVAAMTAPPTWSTTWKTVAAATATT
jgi:L-seryl-tRNA(Ser) seleniumtransferase